MALHCKAASNVDIIRILDTFLFTLNGIPALFKSFDNHCPRLYLIKADPLNAKGVRADPYGWSLSEAIVRPYYNAED